MVWHLLSSCHTATAPFHGFCVVAGAACGIAPRQHGGFIWPKGGGKGLLPAILSLFGALTRCSWGISLYQQLQEMSETTLGIMLPLPCNVEPFMKPIWLVVFRIMIAMPTLSRENFLCTLNSQSKKLNSEITRSKQSQRNTQIRPLRTVNDCEKTNTCTCKTAFTPESVPRIPGHSDVFDLLKNVDRNICLLKTV